MKRHCLTYLVFLFSIGNCFSSFLSVADTSGLNKLFSTGFAAIYNFKFHLADSIAEELKEKFPMEEKTYLFIANSYWWKIRSGEDNANTRKQFMTALTSVEVLLDKKKRNELSYEDLFNYIHVYSYMARLELLDENYFNAFSYMNKCNMYLFTSFGKELSYEPFNLTTGLYNFYLVTGKQKYPPLIPFLMLLPSADKEMGIKYLKRCSESSDENLQTEGNYFLMIIYGESDINYPLSADYSEKLCKKYPLNLLYRYYHFSVLLQDEKKDDALVEYNQLYLSSIMNKELSSIQQKYFISLAQKDLEKYYIKHPSKESRN